MVDNYDWRGFLFKGSGLSATVWYDAESICPSCKDHSWWLRCSSVRCFDDMVQIVIRSMLSKKEGYDEILAPLSKCIIIKYTWSKIPLCRKEHICSYLRTWRAMSNRIMIADWRNLHMDSRKSPSLSMLGMIDIWCKPWPLFIIEGMSLIFGFICWQFIFDKINIISVPEGVDPWNQDDPLLEIRSVTEIWWGIPC